MIPVTYIEALLILDKELKTAEEEILTGDLGNYRSLLDNQSRGHFSSEVENVLEEVHSKWSELEKEKPTPTPSIRRGFKWKDFSKGYARVAQHPKAIPFNKNQPSKADDFSSVMIALSFF